MVDKRIECIIIIDEDSDPTNLKLPQTGNTLTPNHYRQQSVPLQCPLQLPKIHQITQN